MTDPAAIARAAERAAIVAWLRHESRKRANERVAKLHWRQAEMVANAIEQGSHLLNAAGGGS